MSVSESLELSYLTYQERQLAAVSADGVKNSLLKAKCSDKFTFENDRWVKHPYPGYAVASMLDTNPDNERLSTVLQAVQADLIWETKLNEYIFQLPAPSFHQTVANTLSSDRFLTNIRSKGLEYAYPQWVEQAFETYQQTSNDPIKMRIRGISIFGSSLGVLGTFDHEEGFNRILSFRNHFYDTSDLNALGIKCTRPFIGHITLGYFGQDLTPEAKDKLYRKIEQLNAILAKEELFFTMENTALRRYDELSVFQDLPNYPVVQL